MTDGQGQSIGTIDVPPPIATMPVLPMTNLRPMPQPLGDDPRWYRKAVFYELLVRAFQDSNNDGVGDFPGLLARLDYLQWLGVDCIWLLPFNASPLRDGGYDISDYYNVLPEFGTIEDVRRVVEEAHRRGMRVIMDLVMNHTSSDHPWFQSARSSPNSPYRNWYVWSDTPEKYKEARIIFLDTEPSNWTYDEQAGQFYWHRFFSHQPDLNYDNPAVQEEMLNVLRFWLDLGMDGFRLDAVPYLYEREGTNGENLPETHSFLAKVREVVDREYPNRVLLAEANQWPEDAVAYFGTFGRPEAHMNFHFPLMPRLFMGVRREDSIPIREILARTPDIPPGAQWGIFLRNHDELTLEMVTDEERDYMWAEYAHDPRMRLNLGIRRRLAPLLDNSEEKIKLFTSLLLSMPGSPIMYYGDEIGMGDNIWLGDRDGVRTPMQWSADRNAGFSRCDPGQLYLPPIMNPTYGFQALNVEAQMTDSSSMLNWVRRHLRIRRQWPIFGEGGFQTLEPNNRTIFAFVRLQGDQVVLCVNNLSRYPQPASMDLTRWIGRTPVELEGKVRFPPISENPYVLSLAPHGFFWFSLEPS